MTSPIFAGLGRALTGLGSDFEQKALIDRQNALLDEQRRRQSAQDALSRLVTLSQLGGSEVPDGTDPNDAVQSMQQYNTLRSSGAIPNAALGVSDESVPNAFGSPRLIKLPSADGQSTINVVIDPSKTPQALMERRQSMTQDRLDRREREKLDAENARQQAGIEAKTLAGVKAARADG